MQILVKYLQKRWVYHILIWLLMIIPSLIFAAINHINIPHTLFSFSPLMFAVYANFYIKKLFFDKKLYYKYVFALWGIGFLGGISSIIIYQEVNDFFTFSFLLYFLGEAVAVMVVAVLAGGLQHIKRNLVNSYKLKEQVQELKIQNTASELQSLKAQINPHFLFNNLNNIYATVELNTEKGAEMIIELSEVMRYHLQSSKKTDITLTEEIQLIKSYIELEKLRLNTNCDLKIDLPAESQEIKLAPLLFLPFIENAFKHGTHPTQDCFVHLSLKANAKQILFEVNNSIIKHKKVAKTHIGLENTRKRLELIYPEKHELKIEKNEKEYLVELKISLY